MSHFQLSNMYLTLYTPTLHTLPSSKLKYLILIAKLSKMRLFRDFQTLWVNTLDVYSYTLSKDHIFTLRRRRISWRSSTSSEGTLIEARRALAPAVTPAAEPGICPGRYMTLWLLLAALRMLCLSMAALTSENLRWANCSWVGGAKSSEFLGEDLGIGLLMTGGFKEGLRTLLERGDLVKARSEATGKTSFSLAESWLSRRSRTRCSIVEAATPGFGLTKTCNRISHDRYYLLDNWH